MALIKKTVNGYATRTEAALALADSAGSNETSVSMTLTDDDLSNKKFLVYVEVTEACAGDGAIDCRIEGSIDGVTFVTLDASIGMDVDPTGTNSAVAIADLTDFYCPIYRITAFTDGTDTQDAAALTMAYAFSLAGIVK